VRNKQIRPILAIDRERPPEFPDVQTIVELGHPDLDILATDYWFMAPPNVPKARQQILEAALAKTLKDPEFLKWAKTADVEPKFVSGDDTLKNSLKAFGLIEQYKGDIEKYFNSEETAGVRYEQKGSDRSHLLDASRGVISVWSYTFPFGTRKAPGPALLPFTLGVLIIFLGGIVLLQAISSMKKGTLKMPPPFIREKEGLIRVGFTLEGCSLPPSSWIRWDLSSLSSV